MQNMVRLATRRQILPARFALIISTVLAEQQRVQLVQMPLQTQIIQDQHHPVPVLGRVMRDIMVLLPTATHRVQRAVLDTSAPVVYIVRIVQRH